VIVQLHILQAAADYVQFLAAPPAAPTGGINTDGILSFFATKILPILLCLLGIVFIGRANKGEVSKTITSSGIAILGLVFMAGAGTLFFVGDNLVKLLFGG